MSGPRKPTSRGGRSGRSVDYKNFTRTMMKRILISKRSDETETELLGANKLNVEVDFHVIANARSHNTDQFELTHESPGTPVFRRGQPFLMDITFQDRAINFNQDALKIIFSLGPRSCPAKGTKVILPVSGLSIFGDEKNAWDCRVSGSDGKKLSLEVQLPPSAQVGIWKCEIRRSPKNNLTVVDQFCCPADIYILFNPFCQDDLVYMEDPVLRKEYVLNDHGKVWVGSYKKIRGRQWVFGQFDPVVLPVAMYLLELSDIRYSERGSPVKMARAISAVGNSGDEDGLLCGNWSGDYSDGVAPRMWTGSVPIFENYVKNGMSTVCYGQCWVFSAVTVTICRALGIPCRSVTNFVSAHDVDNSLTIDKYFDADGTEMPSGDSMWNFHVWNEVWMARPDLPRGYGGWQVIDATPQELSDSMYRCGPTSVVAIKNGEIGYQYDASFVYAEVNADICHFMEDPTSDTGFTKTEVKECTTGKVVATKSPYKYDEEGDTDMENITLQYKSEEGTVAERMAVFNAVRGCERAKEVYGCKTVCSDVSFRLVDIEKVHLGQPFKVTVIIENKSGQLRTVNAILTAKTVFYTGVIAQPLKKGQRNIVLPPKKKETLEITVTSEEYMDKLVDHSAVKIYALCTVQETKQVWSAEDDFDMEIPKLNIQIMGTPKATTPCQVKFSFTNPLNITLTECLFSFEGPGLTKCKLVAFRDVKPKEQVTHTETFTPQRAGQRNIVAIFNSHQMHQVIGSKTMKVGQ